MNNQIGVIGLAVMGKNLAYNFADHGFATAIYNRTTSVTEGVMEECRRHGWAWSANLEPSHTLEDFVQSLASPRKIILMVQAGKAVDMVIDELEPLLDPGDIIVDGGNSYFKDTERRAQEVSAKGFVYMGLGVSGGEKGARFGPAMMPGGDKAAWEALQPILTQAAASYNGVPCCQYTAKGGAGHFVKMVHNGIEYADMELIAETYFALKHQLGLSNEQLAKTFGEWNTGVLESYLMEITATILATPDENEPGELVDYIMDISHQKGTGKWTTQEAADLGVDVSLITAGLNARYVSMLKDERAQASQLLNPGTVMFMAGGEGYVGESDLVRLAEQALYAAKIIDYAQGFKMLAVAGETYGWDYSFEDIVSIWRDGCIIRAALLEDIRTAYQQDPTLAHLLLSEHIANELEARIPALREFVVRTAAHGMPIPAFMAALAYYDAYRTNPSSANLIQAQRDLFGAHTYERTDMDGVFHHEWE